MRPQVGIRREPRGGFGNRVLSFLSLRQLNEELGVGYFSINQKDRALIERIHKPWRIPLRLRRVREVNGPEIQSEDFLAEARAELNAGTTLILRTPLLGEVYARHDYRAAIHLTKHLMSQCDRHASELGSRPLVVFHLRGTDFATWNPDAILPADYYLSALDLIGPHIEDHVFRICTDDPNHPAGPTLRSHLEAIGTVVARERCDEQFTCDFAAMASADFLISSPSTFSIAAGLLGSPRVVHSGAWITNRIERGELFWQKVRDRSLNGYNVVGEV